MLAGDKTVSVLLKHAYITLPYYKTLQTRAFTNYMRTRTFVMPNTLQFDYIALKVR
jgi:hypothetical protein